MQEAYKSILSFCVGLLEHIKQHPCADDSLDFWLDVAQLHAVCQAGFGRESSLLPDAQEVTSHFDLLHETALQEFRSIKSEALQILIDHEMNSGTEVISYLKKKLHSLRDFWSNDFSWAFACFHGTSDFTALLQKEVLTPIHIVLNDILSTEDLSKVSIDMDKICETSSGQNECLFFYSTAKAKSESRLIQHPFRGNDNLRPAPNPQWEHHSSYNESDYARIREQSVGFIPCSQSSSRPMLRLLCTTSSLLVQCGCFRMLGCLV